MASPRQREIACRGRMSYRINLSSGIEKWSNYTVWWGGGILMNDPDLDPDL